MVKRILRILNIEISGLHEAAFLLGLSSFGSQILALLRDRLLAGNFGAGRELDIYYSSFRIPDLVFVSIGSFLAVTVLIPIIISKIESSDNKTEKAVRFLSEILTVFSLIMAVISAIIVFLMPFLVDVLVPGFGEEARRIVIDMSRILMLSPFLLGLSNLLGSVTQSFKRFFVYALSPIFYNFGIILGIVFFYPIFGLHGLAYGVIFGALMHLVIQIPTVYQMGMLPKLVANINKSEIYKVASLSLPRTMALGVNQLALMFLVAQGSFMKDGSVSVFNFSYNLQSVPLAIIGVSYGVAALPEMSRIFSRNNISEFVRFVEKAFKHIVFWSIPVTVLFIVLRAQIVRTILGTGKFNWENTRLTIAALAVFSISVIAQNLIQLLDRVYYATGKTAKPVVSKLLSSTVIIISGYFFSFLFTTDQNFKFFVEYILRVEGLPGTEMLMLPLAFSLGSIFNLLVLVLLFFFDFRSFSRSFIKTFFDSIVASSVMGLVSYFALVWLSGLFKVDTLFLIFLQGLFAAAIGIFVNIIVLSFLKNEEMLEISDSLHKRFWRVSVMIPGPDESQTK